MRQRVLDLQRVGDSLFSNRMPLMTLWQIEAEYFWPMRADFTRARYPNEEFASYLTSARLLLARRELKNALGAMLRPRDQQWLHARTLNEKVNKALSMSKVRMDIERHPMRRGRRLEPITLTAEESNRLAEWTRRHNITPRRRWRCGRASY
jgi:hypothetical protein